MQRPLLPKTWNTTYQCSACGLSAPVLFTDPAAYDENDPVGGRDKWAQQAALAEAQQKLEKQGRVAMTLARCPACGHRDEQAVKRTYLRAALPLLGAAPMLFLLGVVVLGQVLPGPAHLKRPVLLSALLTGLASIVIVWRGQRRLLKEAQSSLRFSLAATPSPAPTVTADASK
jgi:predicted RNA-binding Zn-ribbon protein involved in translation (DUF1610 family)